MKTYHITHKQIDLLSFAVTFGFLMFYGYFLATNLNGLVTRDAPVGNDFYAFWTAGKVALSSGFSAPYDAKILQAFQISALPLENTHINYWFYPPLLLYWLALFWAQFPYVIAYFIFILMSFALYFYSVKSFYPQFSLNVLLGFPALIYCIIAGQNGAISAFLMITALINLEKRPVIAGILFGLLAYKPQLCLLIPFALIASRQWTVIIAGVLTLILSIVFSLFVFGMDTWFTFFNAIIHGRDLMQGQGRVGFEKMASLFMALRFWGINETISYVIHGIFVLFIIFKTIQIWKTGDFSHKAMTLILGTLLISPHIFEYDYVMSVLVIIMFLKIKNFRLIIFEIVIIFILWFTPYIGRTLMEVTSIPLLFICSFCLFLMITHESKRTS